ncbi:hypothetical protein Tco_1150740, partial [Tanacetum coccineum]
FTRGRETGWSGTTEAMESGVVIIGPVKSLVRLANVGIIGPIGFGFVKPVDLVIGGPAGL